MLKYTVRLILAFACVGLFASTGWTQAPRRATFDFTGDGSSDLLFASANAYGFWDVDASGSFTVRYMGGGTGGWGLTGTGDYNADGTSDLLFRHGQTGAVGYWTVRDGVMTSFVPLIWDTSPRWHIVGALARTDFNGDGRDDILWRHDSGQLGLYSMTGSGPFQFDWTIVGTFPRQLVVIGTGDFNADGRDDVLWRDQESGHVHFMSLAGGVPTSTDLGTQGVEWRVTAIGDFDNDRADDIFWESSPSALYGWWDVNGGRVAGFRTVPSPGPSGVAYPSGPFTVVASGDYRGDGSEDLAWTSTVSFPPIGPIGIAATRTDFVAGAFDGHRSMGTYELGWQMSARLLSGTLGPPPARRTSYDFLENGSSDLLFRDANGTFLVWDVRGAYTGSRLILGSADPLWDVIGVGDYNGDANSDILFRHQVSGVIGYWKVYRGSVAGFVTLSNSVGAEWQVVSSRQRADFNGDGRDDLLLRRADGLLAMALVAGVDSSSLQWIELGASDPMWTVEGTADFSGDGVDDILFRHAASGSVGYVRMAASGMQEWVGLIAGLDNGWFVGSLGDYNGDGFDDIYWRTSTTLPEGYWNMAGGRLSGFVANAQLTQFPGAIRRVTSGSYDGDSSVDLMVAYANANGALTNYTLLPFANGRMQPGQPLPSLADFTLQ